MSRDDLTDYEKYLWDKYKELKQRILTDAMTHMTLWGGTPEQAFEMIKKTENFDRMLQTFGKLVKSLKRRRN